MKCEQIRDMLSVYIDGMTNEKENKIITTHLNSCSQCQKELEQLRSFCLALNNLPDPELPEGFGEDLRKRLVDANTFLFRPKEIKKPKQQGWIAAGVAGIALAAGIYASTVLPIAPMIASWHEKQVKPNDDNKPAVAINEIINRLDNGEEQQVEVAQTPTGEENSPTVAHNIPPVNAPVETTDLPEPDGTNVSPEPPAEVTPKIADIYSARLSVQNAGASLKEVVQLAQNNGWNYEYSNTPLAMSGISTTSGLTIKVDQNDLDKAIDLLNTVGKVSVPSQSSWELTQNYCELEKQIAALQEEQQNLQQAENPDQDKLNNIENQIQEILKQKAALDKELEMVTLNVTFVEEVNP